MQLGKDWQGIFQVWATGAFILTLSSCGRPPVEIEVDPVVKKISQGEEFEYGFYDRNGKQVCYTVSKKSGEPDVGSSVAGISERYYFVQNRCVGREQDTDGDGFFETLILTLPTKEGAPLMGDDPFEVFIRNPDGAVSVGDNEIRQEFKNNIRNEVTRAKQQAEAMFGKEK